MKTGTGRGGAENSKRMREVDRWSNFLTRWLLAA